MLVAFQPRHAPDVLSWARDARELAFWAALDEPPDRAVFERWHADEDITAFVLTEEGAPVAYGEIWDEPEEDSIELGRILVAPAHRRSGIGSRLVRELVGRAGARPVWVRVLPDNAAALRLYESLGFERAPAARQRELNRPQPRDYVWLSSPPASAPTRQ